VVRALINGREGVAITTSYDNALLLFNLLTSQVALQIGSAPFGWRICREVKPYIKQYTLSAPLRIALTVGVGVGSGVLFFAGTALVRHFTHILNDPLSITDTLVINGFLKALAEYEANSFTSLPIEEFARHPDLALICDELVNSLASTSTIISAGSTFVPIDNPSLPIASTQHSTAVPFENPFTGILENYEASMTSTSEVEGRETSINRALTGLNDHRNFDVGVGGHEDIWDPSPLGDFGFFSPAALDDLERANSLRPSDNSLAATGTDEANFEIIDGNYHIYLPAFASKTKAQEGQGNNDGNRLV